MIALTCGEPAGIGPEIAASAWARLRGRVPFFLIGDPAHLPEGTPVTVIDDPAEAARAGAEALPVLAHPFAGRRTPGRPQAAQAQGVIDVIARGVDLVQTGQAAALCTAPIHKQALQEGAGFAFPGHTEYLAHLAGGCRVAMMLAGPTLRVVPATIHMPLSEVPRALTPESWSRPSASPGPRSSAISASPRRGSPWPGSTRMRARAGAWGARRSR